MHTLGFCLLVDMFLEGFHLLAGSLPLRVNFLPLQMLFPYLPCQTTPPQEAQSPVATNKNSSHPRHIQRPCISLRTHPCREDVIAPILEMWKLRLRELKCCPEVSGRAKLPPQRARCRRQLGLLLATCNKTLIHQLNQMGCFFSLT